MVLSIRAKQTEALVRMLHLNAQASAVPGAPRASDADTFKILVLDRQTKDIVAPLLRVSDLRKHGVTLHLMIDTDRQSIPDVPAVYFVAAHEEQIKRIVQDAAAGLYEALHLNFVTSIPGPIMEQLASGAVASSCVQRIAKVHDQYLAFIALEAGLFTLGLPNAYLDLNDPAAGDTQIEAALAVIVDGLFSAIATLGVVPIIRCPQGALAHVLATKLDARIREHLKLRSNLFSESASGLAGSLARPLLCLFDRNFELSVILQHAWTYRPLVHDVLGMSLNRITLDPEPSTATPLPGAKPPLKRSVEVGEGDFFWEANARLQFPDVAKECDAQLGKYKQAVEEMNRQTGARVNPDALPDDMMSNSSNTRGLMSAVSQLPALIERKRTIEKHTSILHKLLESIKPRQLDQFYRIEEDMLSGKAPLTALLQRVQQAPDASPHDKLRAALVYMSTCATPPGDGDYAELERTLRESAPGLDLAALHYVRRMRRMKLTGRSGPESVPGSSAAPAGGALSNLAAGGGSHILSWADRTFGQGLTSLTRGVKDLLAGEQQAAVTVAVEGLMDAKPAPELESFATFDPRAPAGRAYKAAGPYREAIVFMIGGGNYLEAESLSTWASRSQPQKSVMYGTTEMLTGEQFADQLSELGRRSGSAT